MAGTANALEGAVQKNLADLKPGDRVWLTHEHGPFALNMIACRHAATVKAIKPTGRSWELTIDGEVREHLPNIANLIVSVGDLRDLPNTRPVRPNYQQNWRDLITSEGSEAAARLRLAKALRDAADQIERGGFPDVYGCAIPDHGLLGDSFVAETTIVLSNPWPG